MLHIPPTKVKYSSPNRSKKQKQEPHELAYLSEKEVVGNRGQENGPKAKNDTTERATRLSRRTREEI